jgi:hypothetical protein
MRRFAPLCAAFLMILLAISPATAAAQTTGSETFDGFLIVSGASGSREVLASGIRARGVFNGVGRIVERENLPGDPDNVSRDDLVFPDGTMHIVNVTLDVSSDLNPISCIATFTVQQETSIEGGTGIFADATGSGTATVIGRAKAQRAPDGSCDMNQLPLFEHDKVTASGTLSF